jgi:hypothetical protein
MRLQSFFAQEQTARFPLTTGSVTMPLLHIVLVLIIVGVLLELVNRYIPMAPSIRTILNIVVVATVAVWVLQAVGLWGRLAGYRPMH